MIAKIAVLACLVACAYGLEFPQNQQYHLVAANINEKFLPGISELSKYIKHN